MEWGKGDEDLPPATLAEREWLEELERMREQEHDAEARGDGGWGFDSDEGRP